jgi:hypothetical protein
MPACARGWSGWYSPVMAVPRARRARPRALVALLLLPLAVGVQLLGARFPEAVEALYSRRAYPRVVAALAWASSRLSFSLAEAGLAIPCAAFAWGLFRLVRALWRGKGQRARILARATVLALLVAGASDALFLLVWGLNYQRVTFGQLAGLPVRPSEKNELITLTADLIDSANRWREGLPEDERGALRLADGAPGALTRTPLGVAAFTRAYPWLPRPAIRPKAAWSSPLLARLGILGFYSPLTAEAHVDVDAPASDIPFCSAHEVAHELGFAREDEANYVGYLICRLHPDADFAYSGAYIASSHALAALRSVDRAEARRLDSRRSPAVKRDVAASAAWLARYKGPVMNAARRVNDAYLRTQGQEGVRSYGRMVDLLLAEQRARPH